MQAAAVALIGRSLGEQNADMAKLYGRICQRMGNVISIVLAFVYILGGRRIVPVVFC